jgi:hypothetical protein
VTVCGVPKAINSRALPLGPLADLIRRIGAALAASGTALAPLVELCR